MPIEIGRGRQWFDDVIIGARPEGANLFGHRSAPGDAGNQHLVELGIGLEGLDQVVPIAIRQIKFQNDQTRAFALNELPSVAKGTC